jgi:hypothetical protein
MQKPPRIFFTLALCVIGVLFTGANAFAQSNALDAQIEGYLHDQNGAALQGASVIATNTSTGFVRTVVTDGKGFYRLPLMPLGEYRLVAEGSNGMRAVREGVTLVTGQAASIDLTLMPGLTESVVVNIDGPFVDAGKSVVGRVMDKVETTNLPLVSRNPLSFLLLQTSVNGRPARGFNFPNISANGYLRRVNFQIDGSSATQADRAGVRLMQISGTYVNEVQLVTNSFAPEFGNTPGLIMNIVTPSGTNDIRGTLSYLFRRPSFYSRPFGYTSEDPLPDNSSTDLAAAVGLPVVRDRWHLYGGYEQYKRDDKTLTNRLLSISPDDRADLIAAGLPDRILPRSVPALEYGRFILLRTDLQINDTHRLALRLNNSDDGVKNNIQGTMANGVTNTLERSVDNKGFDLAIAGQLASYTNRLINELRFQFVRRKVNNVANEFSGSGPSIVVSNLVSFGAPENTGTISPLERQMQVQDSVTLVRGAHVAKFGGGFVRINDLNRSGVFSRYTFASIEDYIAARGGQTPFSYEKYDESSGDPESRYNSTFWNLFIQDDWRITNRLKLTFGLRYDLYQVPKADPNAAYEPSRKFKLDKDNFAPRVSAVYALRQGERPTVLRFGAGMYYETPWLSMYERALLRNGDPRYVNYSVPSTAPAAPAFPTTFPGELPLQTQQDIDAVSPDLENLYAIHTNVQLEQAINTDVSFAVGYVHSGGRQIAVYRSINFIPISYLADGRPVFSQTPNAETRYDRQFNNILMAESAGTSQYSALAIQFNVRSWKNLHFSANYTLSKATDDAPEQNIALGNPTNSVLSNPFDRSFDRGRSYSDQRHTFVISLVARPVFEIENDTLRRILNNNQIGVITYANSGQAFNIVSVLDLNQDGLRQDRPIGVPRNSGTTPPLFNLDLRYSRFVPFGERFRLELFAEFTNFFNVNSIVQYNNTTVATEMNGNLIGSIPDFRSRNQSTSQESRQTQLGIRFQF